MGGIKHMMDEEAERLGLDDMNDARVQAAVEARLRRMDPERWVSDKAEEIAQQRCAESFDDLPASMQMEIWMEAEQELKERKVEAQEARR